MTELETTHSHLYPGARGRVLSGAAYGPVTVSFADGIRVSGTLEGDRLTVTAHRTAKGAAIPEKTWTIRIEGDAFRIFGRIT